MKVKSTWSRQELSLPCMCIAARGEGPATEALPLGLYFEQENMI